MSERDIFHEVEEEMRRERLAGLWDKYGVYVLIVALIIVAGVGGVSLWNWWQAKQAAENGETFAQAVTLLEDGKQDEALAIVQRVATGGPRGYGVLAELQRAAIAANKGNKQEAVKAYDAIADKSSADEMLRGFSRIQAAALRLDEADLAEMRRRLEGMTPAQNPWRHSAKELLGLAAFKSGKTSDAGAIFGEIAADPAAPAQLRQRAEMMLALIVKQPERRGEKNGQGGQAQNDAKTH